MEKRSLQRHLDWMNRKYFFKKCRLIVEHDEIAKFAGEARQKMGAEKALLIEQLQEARNEILRLKYALASCKIDSKAKEEVNRLKEEFYVARGKIRDLYYSSDAKKSAVDDILSEFVTIRRTIADLSIALHKDKSSLTKL